MAQVLKLMLHQLLSVAVRISDRERCFRAEPSWTRRRQ